MTTATPPEAELARGLANGRLVGHYLRILGWASLLRIAFRSMAGQGLHLDLGFLLFLWLGGGLLRGKEGFRKGVTVLCGLYAALAFIGLTLTLAISNFSLSVLSATRELAILQNGRVLATTAPPFALLLSSSTRSAYRSARGAELPQPAGSALGWIYYVLGTVVLAGVPVGMAAVQDQASLAWSSTSRGASGPSTVAVRLKTKRHAVPLHLAAWIVTGPQTSVGSSADNSIIHVDGAAVEVPGVRSVRFLLPPAEPTELPNVFLASDDGTIIRVERRVTLATLAAAEQTLQGAKDFSEIRERLERALPPLPK